MTPYVRKATTDGDWAQATSLMQRVYVDGGYTQAANAAQFMTRENLEPAGVLLIAMDGAGTVVGVVVLPHEESPLRQVAEANEREFRLLAVDAGSRGSGVGEQLVQECMARARTEGARAMVLWSQPSMSEAHRLYERLGFSRAPERDQEDPRGFTRMVFRKEL
jgi:GNAT superfamily N-acetyltransferase